MRILLAINNAHLKNLVKNSFVRFRYEWDQVDNGFDAFQKIVTTSYDLVIMEYELPRMQAVEVMRRLGSLDKFSEPPVIIITRSEEHRQIVEKSHFAKTQVISRPLAIRSLVGAVQQTLHQELRIVCIGGGTGLFTLLSGLKTLPGAELFSIVSMSDDGGSTGILRDMFGILPPGDIRRSLIALSTAPDLLNHLMQYRFKQGKGLEGHNLGNLLLTALVQMRGSMTNAVKDLGEILNIQGHVIPVTESVNTLKAECEDGTLIEGESHIDLCHDRDHQSRIVRLWQEPPVSATPDAIEAIYNANFIIMGPGDLFTSLISNFLVDGISEAICSSRAKKIYVCNIMTKPGETSGLDVKDHVLEMIKYIGEDVFDYVVCAVTSKFKKTSLDAYKEKGQEPVHFNEKIEIKKVTKAKIIQEELAAEEVLVRHDSLKLAAVIKNIIDKNKPKWPQPL